MAVPLTIDIPEPFRSALAQNVPRDVADAEAPTAEALFGRGLARMAVGRGADARADFEAALPTLGDPCRVELALVDIQDRSAVADALKAAKEVIERAPPNSRLAARALHVAGLALGKLRKTSQAADTLLQAAEAYRTLGDRLGGAQVQDTLGMLHASRGRFDHALQAYSLALVDKTLLNDLSGMAITLGNLGRLHLRAGRFRDALECFGRDLEIAQRLGDLRGQARMREDMGQAYLGLEQFDQAQHELDESLELARGAGYNDLVFFTLKDRARLRVAQGRLDEAEADLAAARQALPGKAEPYFQAVVNAVQGELLAAKDDPKAIDVLEQAVRDFQAFELPDMEISCRIALAQAQVRQKLKARAEQCLLGGLRLARSDGYARYLPKLNEAMAALELVEGALDESRPAIGEGARSLPGAYLIRQRLGAGGFGEVFRAYDPERNRDVALKRLHLDRLYDLPRRQHLLASARVELEAASRVRHPGVARVLAVGTDPEGGAYVVQEFISGRPLRMLMPGNSGAKALDVLDCLERVADALAALHAAGVVHRDLKPENILVRDDGLPVLVDFGLAHVAGALDTDDENVAGTRLYMAPEQAQGKRVDGRADLYALGVVAYEWLAGVVPLRPRGGDFAAWAKDLGSRPPPRLSEFRHGLSDKLEQLVMSLLAKNPKRRPTTALAVAVQMCELAAAQRIRGEATTSNQRT